MKDYLSSLEVAEKWGVTPRQVQILCKSNRVNGAIRISRMWIIPKDAKKPTGDRKNVFNANKEYAKK